MDRPDARAGQHGDGRLRDHRHVEDDAVALADLKLVKHGAESSGLRLKLGIGERALRAGDRAVVDDRCLPAAPARHVPVDGVVAGIAEGAGEPAPIDASVRIEHFFRRPKPLDLAGRLGPEAGGVCLPARVGLLVAADARRVHQHGISPGTLFSLALAKVYAALRAVQGVVLVTFGGRA
jgi:hypothetical protein